MTTISDIRMSPGLYELDGSNKKDYAAKMSCILQKKIGRIEKILKKIPSIRLENATDHGTFLCLKYENKNKHQTIESNGNFPYYHTVKSKTVRALIPE